MLLQSKKKQKKKARLKCLLLKLK